MRRTSGMMKSLKVAMSFAIILALLIVGTALAAATTVDTFDAGSQNILANNVAPQGFNTVNNAVALGGNRDAVVNWASGSAGTLVTLRIDVGDTNQLAYTSDNATRGTASVQWDGNADASATVDPDGMCTVAGCPAGTGKDLTGGGTNDGLHFEVPFNDIPIDVTIRYWSSGNSGDYDTYTLQLPGGIFSGHHVDFFVPFTSFSAVGAGADQTNVGAVEVFINGDTVGSAGADVSIDFLEFDNFREYGDAPITYGEPSHLANGLRLGTNEDIESAAFHDINAVSDDNDQAPPDDEDGVRGTPGVLWVDGVDGGSLDIEVNGCSGVCYLNGWMDWDDNGNFTDAGDQIFTNQVVTNFNYAGAFAFTIDVPAGKSSNSSFYARFRVCNAPGACDTPGATNVAGGEVEDYLWVQGPNAVRLTGLTARSSVNNAIAIGLFGLLAVIAASAFLWTRRRKLG